MTSRAAEMLASLSRAENSAAVRIRITVASLPSNSIRPDGMFGIAIICCDWRSTSSAESMIFASSVAGSPTVTSSE